MGIITTRSCTDGAAWEPCAHAEMLPDPATRPALSGLKLQDLGVPEGGPRPPPTAPGSLTRPSSSPNPRT